MNTNINLDSAANSELAAALNGTFQALAAGLPDPAELARIANHFFNEGQTQQMVSPVLPVSEPALVNVVSSRSPHPGLSDIPHLNPQIPGAVLRATESGYEPLVSFHSLNRSLYPSVITPVLLPDWQDPALPDKNSTIAGGFDVRAIRRDFPILQEKLNGKPLIWLDNAATTQKPQAVIDRLKYFYEHENSNVHRAAHTLAARSTDAYDGARERVRRFLNAASVREIIFVRGATEGINLIANTWGKKNISAGDEIVISHLEHHANIVPWQILAAEKGARLRIIPVNDQGELLLEEYKNLLNPRTKLVAFTHVSNALGTITPVQEIVSIARQHGITTLVDGSQGVSHMKVDVQAYGADFYVFSGHKLFAPTGIGAVYGRLEVLESLPPWQGGGNMIVDVTFEKTVYHPAPFRFEAGTGNIADAVGLGAAIDYLENLGMDQIGRYEHELLRYATEHLQQIPGLRFIGTAKNKASVLSFVLEGFSNDEIGQYLNQAGIAVRTGHHCAQPILRRFGVESTVRPSLAFYNTCEEVDALVSAVWKLKNGQNIGI
jgi:cysteine desulfurase/selenocysteine lyase